MSKNDKPEEEGEFFTHTTTWGDEPKNLSSIIRADGTIDEDALRIAVDPEDKGDIITAYWGPSKHFRGTIATKVAQKAPAGMKPFLKRVKYGLASLLDNGRLDMFANVSLETTSICKRKCGYCPNSDDELVAQRPQKDMDPKLYSKIIDDLASTGFEGRLSLQHYGEPLEDPMIVERVREAREKMPSAIITIFSNGDKMTPLTLSKLVRAGISSVLVTDHGNSTTVRDLGEYLKNDPELAEYCTIRKGIQTMTTRGGLVEIEDGKRREMTHCVAEAYTLVVDVEGKVVLCSEDYLAQEVQGDLNQSSIMQVWDSPAYKQVRSETKKGVFKKDICRKCAGQ